MWLKNIKNKAGLMILFKDDWNKPEYRNAIIDWDTGNEYFLHYVGVLEKIGVENRFWPLALHNPLLKGVDPFDPNLTDEFKVMIVLEAKDNPWYFFREVLRIPVQGSLVPSRFRAHRGNMAVYWTYMNHVTIMHLLPRQRGKTLGINCLWVWVLDLAAQNTKIGLFTKDNDLRTTTVKQLKDIIDELPPYFNIRTRHDTNNTETITNKALNNVYMTAVAQASPKAALNVFRGHSIPNFHNDETAFCLNNRITMPAMLAAGTAARKNAEASGSPYGTIFTTTAGYLNTDMGMYAREIYEECLPWTEALLDCKDRDDLYETIRNNNRTRLVDKDPTYKKRAPLQLLLEFNHRQLGVSDEQLLEDIENAKAEGDAVDADFFNKWVRGSDASPIDPDTLEIMHKSIDENYHVTIEMGYILRWFVPKHEVDNKLRNRVLVIGCDPSEAVGSDDVGLTIMDLYTGELVGAGNYNATNVIKFAMWLSYLLESFPTTTLIIERKNMGTAILDALFINLTSKGIDPLKRIYNRIVDEMREIPEYADMVKTNYRYRDSMFYVNNKKKFGYTTTGEGKHARDNIYFRAFKGAVSYLPHLVRDKVLYEQLAGLIFKNERIDHRPGMHDDLVFSWLLCYYFATVARNKEIYGVNPNMIFRSIREKMEVKEDGNSIAKRQKQEAIMARLDQILKAILATNSQIDKEELKHMYNNLSKQLDDDKSRVYDIDTLLNEIDNERKIQSANVLDYFIGNKLTKYL